MAAQGRARAAQFSDEEFERRFLEALGGSE